MQAGSRFIEFAADELEGSVPQRFEQQVHLHPRRIAVKTNTREITYPEFNDYANRIAWTISQRSSRDKPAALLLDHDLAAIFSIFAALKAGRSFVPLDPSLPSSRLKYMLDDSGADLIVTNHQRFALADELFDHRRIIDIDQIDTLEAGNLDLSISPDSMSCLLYTSGITGRPKGVVHTHRNELHNVMHHTNTLFISADDRLTLLGSYSTGQGMQDLYCALLNGATLYPWNLKVDGLSGLAGWLIKEKITIYHSAATVYRCLIRTLTGQEEFPDLRIVRLGSEHVSWKDVEAYKQHFSTECVFINALSSSETKTICQYVVNKDTHIPAQVPVGYAVADTEVSILDEFGNPLESGNTGEIAVRSRFISPRYWRDPNSTNTAHMVNSSFPEERVFRTGEWGRMSAEGCLEHLGRRDAQVQIRGYRVEIFETELALLSHPSVAQVLVLCRENKKGDKYLVAYISANGSLVPTISDLRTFLRRKIPEYMIPSAFVFLESFPLTQNGKVDHGALPEPDTARPALDNRFVPPTGPVEQTLAEISTEVLGIDGIGVYDNHFDLGGNSLTAMQVVARAERQFGVTLSLKQFFESPAIADLSRTILAVFGSTAPLNDLRIEPAPRDGLVPLSFAQQRLWFLDQWEPGSPVYNICRAYRLRGKLDVGAMQESLKAIVQRHEVLRTCFPAIDGQPAQAVASFITVPIPLVDLSSLAEAKREENSLQIAAEDANQPFDLAKGPILKAKLVRLADDEHLFVFTVHQIACDGWSMHILEREFWAIYDAVKKHVPPALPTLGLQYADFAIWQRQRMQDTALQGLFTYWKKQLSEPWPFLNLPTDRPRPARRSFRGSRQALALPESLAERVKELGRRERVTLFMTLITAFQVLLHRYVDATDLLVGFPIANRNWRDTAEVVGFFVNTVVLRLDFSGPIFFRELLFKTREACIAAYVHQDLPFDKLIEELRPPRDASHNPVFQAMFVQQVAADSSVALHGVVLEPVEIGAATSKFDLTFSLAERHKGLGGFIEYSADLFDPDTIERMATHYRTLLEAVVADPNQPIATLRILPEAERHKILVEWNDTAADYPKDKCIHQLFEEQVERTPEAVAVEFDDQQITYRELNLRANQLAHYLISLGIGPEKFVGICVERSIEMVVGLLGILKAGGAYVPLDPSYPEERLRFMLDDADIAVLLTQESLLGRTQNSTLSSQPLILYFDRDWPLIAQQQGANPRQAVKSDSLAYVIYTSGSTGKPKGVQIEHRSVVNCLKSVADRLGFNEHDVLLAVTTIAFDISALELFLPLFVGGKVVVTSRDQAADGSELGRLLANSRVTALQATPSTWRLLIEAGWEGLPSFTILCGGEAMSRDLAEALLTRGEVWNLYGPTETTIWSTVEKVEHGKGPVLIGRPLANTRIYILDSHLQPVPIGVHGDLYIGGDGLARGYWNNPELTAEWFIANPFSEEADARLYRTGDRARYRPDGSIEFLGRTDNQVKIRGHRIELGEIESALLQHPEVRETVVIPFDDSADTSDNPKSKIENPQSLVAYVVPHDKPEPTSSEMRRFLQNKLPDYMLPSSFVFLDSLPVMSNGKLDRKALRLPDGDHPLLDQVFVEPRTAIEELVAQVWREVLLLDNIGIHDNFFELGGHSLLAVRVVYRLRDAFQVHLPLRDFFEAPTVAGSANRLGLIRNTRSLPAITEVSRSETIPPSIAQESILMLAELFPKLHQFNIPAAYRLKGSLNLAALKQAISRLIERHETLRTVFITKNGKRFQSILKSLSLNLDAIDLRELGDPEREPQATALVREEFQRPFDLARGPLFRVKVFCLSDTDHIFVFILHHIISDGWSMTILGRDLAEFYNAILRGHQPRLPDLPVQYVDFTVWQREALRKGLMEEQLSYWKKQLSEPLAPLEFSSVDQNDVMNFFTARKTFSVSGQFFHSFKSLVRQVKSTTFVVLLSVLNLLLHRYLGQEDIRIGTMAANRNRNETENVIGYFGNTLILRTRVSQHLHFRELVQQVADTNASANSYQDLPFEKLLQELESGCETPPKRLSPFFFVFQRRPLPINLSDLSVSMLDDSLIDNGAPEIVLTAFDLVMSMKEGSEGLSGFLIYKMFVFDETMVGQFTRNFENLLAAVVSDPDKSVSALCSSLEI